MKKLPEINVIIMKIEQPLTNIKQEKNLLKIFRLWKYLIIWKINLKN